MSDGVPRRERDKNEPSDWHRSANACRDTDDSEGIDTGTRLKDLHQLSLMLHRPDEADFSQPSYRKSYNDAEQRQFMRCRLTGGQTQGVFSIGGKRFPCRLIEMSIGGFGILIAGSSQFVSGAVGSLRVPNLSYVVSVTRCEPRDGICFVGLKQVEEVLDHNLRLPGEPSPNTSYFISVVSGILIAVVCYLLMAAT